VKIGISVDNEIADTIDQLVLNVRKAMREGKLPSRGPGRPVGPGSVAGEIVELVIRKHPEILRELFSTAGDSLSESVAPFDAKQVRPKAASHR
jgi:hypothetical protein